MDALEKHKKELLRKYIDGNINQEERHQLERLALDDPFLFDALEGFAFNKKQNTLKTIDNIDFSNVESSATPVISSYKPLRRLLQIAAGFILLAAAGYFIHSEIDSNESSEVIFSDSNDNPESVPIVQDLSVSEPPKIELGSENEDYSDKSPTAPVSTTSKKIIQEISKSTEIPKSKIKSPVENTLEQEVELSEMQIEKVTSTPAPKDDLAVKGSRQKTTDYYVDGIRVRADEEEASADAVDMSAEVIINMPSGFSGPYNISGIVLDKTGDVLIGATVVDNITGKTVQSDLKGNFTIELPKKQSLLLAKYPGYYEQYFIANYAFQNNTELEETGQTVDALQVCNLENQTKGTYAELEIGIDSFIEKLEEFKSYNQSCQDRVVFIISINKNGNLIDLYMPCGMKDQCTEEFFQYLKQLGKWQTTPREKAFLHRIEINFNTN